MFSNFNKKLIIVIIIFLILLVFTSFFITLFFWYKFLESEKSLKIVNKNYDAVIQEIQNIEAKQKIDPEIENFDSEEKKPPVKFGEEYETGLGYKVSIIKSEILDSITIFEKVYRPKSGNKFVNITLAKTNTGSKPSDGFDIISRFVLYHSNAKLYNTSETVYRCLEDSLLPKDVTSNCITDELNPGQTGYGYLIFEVPEGILEKMLLIAQKRDSEYDNFREFSMKLI